MNIKYPKISLKTREEKDVEKEDVIEIYKDEIATNIFSCCDCVTFLGKRHSGILREKSFWLDWNYDWIIVKDEMNVPCLIPLKKKDC